MFSPMGSVVSASCVVLLIVWPSHGSEIIDGTEVEPHSLPFMALMIEKTICGGTLIDPKWVLTAAHCEDFEEVFLGVHAVKKKGKDAWQVVKVQQPYPHPCYNAADSANDLKLLKVKEKLLKKGRNKEEQIEAFSLLSRCRATPIQLKKAVKLTETVKCLPLGNTVEEPAAGAECLVAGWGKTSQVAKHMSDVLMSVNVTVIDRVRCNSPDYYGLKPVITSTMVCAGSNGKNRADTCEGDSGGPLLCDGALVGVTSFGAGCGLIKKPGVYSFLSKKQLIWIKSTMKKSEMQ